MDTVLQRVLTSSNVRSVLDIGAGKGLVSIFCASFGCTVDALDKKRFPQWMDNHPHVNLLHTPIEKFEFQKRYDLVIMRNILHAVKKDFALKILLPHTSAHLASGGYVYIVMFVEGDPTISGEKNYFYSLQEIREGLGSFKVVYNRTESLKEDHPPIGPHTHHIRRVLLQKK